MKDKIILFFSLFCIFSICICQDCGTPVECYTKAIQMVKQYREESRNELSFFSQRIQSLESDNTNQKAQIASLQSNNANQQAQIASLQSQLTNQNNAIQSLQAQTNTISGKTNRIEGIVNNYETRGIGNVQIESGSTECKIRFNNAGFYAFFRSDNHFGICTLDGRNCNVK